MRVIREQTVLSEVDEEIIGKAINVKSLSKQFHKGTRTHTDLQVTSTRFMPKELSACC